MARQGPKRKLLRRLGLLLGLLLLLLLAVPLWFPWLFRPVAHRFGIDFATYERAGYGRFVLVDVSFAKKATRFRAAKIEAFVPTVWLWHRCFDREPATYLRAQTWKLEFIQARTTNKEPTRAVSVYTNVNKIGSTLGKLQYWLPKAVLTNGVIEAGGQAPLILRIIAHTNIYPIHLDLPTATWLKGNLTTELPSEKQSGTLQAKLGAAPYEIVFDSASLQLRSVTQFSEDAAGLRLQSTNVWLSNRVEASAQFGPKGDIPHQAMVRADSLRIPAGLLGLDIIALAAGSVRA